MVHQIEPAAAVHINEFCAVAAHDVEWLVVAERERRRQICLPASCDRSCRSNVDCFDGPPIDTNDECSGVRRDRHPYIAFADAGYAIEFGCQPEEIGEQLHVEVRCPAAVLRSCADAGEDGALFDALARSELLDADAVEVADEQPERDVVWSLIFQDDDAAVVAGQIANVAGMNNTCKRGTRGLPVRDEDIDAEMQSASLARRCGE